MEIHQNAPQGNIQVLDLTTTEHQWNVVLFDCYCHFFEEVMFQIEKAINCSSATASQLAHTAQDFGSVSVYHGSESESERIADILGSTGLNVEVSQ